MTAVWDENGWIEIHDWDDHNPGHTRVYSWIKVHKRLLHDPKYLDLTMAQRGVAQGLWILTGELGLGNVPARISKLTILLGCGYEGDKRALRRHLISLNDAGWLDNIACEVHAERMSRKRGEEKPLKVSPSPIVGGNGSPAAPEGAGSPTRVNGQPRKPSATELDDELRPLSPADLYAPTRDAQGFLY